MMANLAPHKGQETAIRAVAELRARGRDVECWLAGTERNGETTYQRLLQARVAELGVGDRVRFLGFRTDGRELIQAADFLLLPSTKEGLPLSVLEAQATKTPVLAAPTAGVPEVVAHGETGFLIAADDPQGYANAVEGLLANPGLFTHVTEQAYDRVRSKHGWPTYCDRVWQLYEELLRPAAAAGVARAG
jgi:glycosyltransferase involved in cell wall biosynthesis